MLSSPLVIYFCDWAVFTLSGGEQLGVQHPATKCYSSYPIFRPTSINAGWCTRPFFFNKYEKKKLRKQIKQRLQFCISKRKLFGSKIELLSN